nr:hypothetical protein BaRGS_032684 [Batillaria attramentaria]
MRRDIVDKVQAFNSHYEGKVHHQMTVEQLPNGEVLVQGPLRIYWGLSRPIQLRQCDDIPNPPIAKWRHSLCGNIENTPQQKTSLQDIPELNQCDCGQLNAAERLLGESDKPLLERLELGADDQSAKIFIKERKIEPEVTVPDTSIQLPIMTEEEEEETLPEERRYKYVITTIIIIIIIFFILLGI